MANSNTQRIGIELFQQLNLNTDVHKYNYNTLQHNTGYSTNGYLHPVEHTQTNYITVNNGEDVHTIKYDNVSVYDEIDKDGTKVKKYIGAPFSATGNIFKEEVETSNSNITDILKYNGFDFNVLLNGTTYEVRYITNTILSFHNSEYVNWYYDKDMVNGATGEYIAVTSKSKYTNEFTTKLIKLSDRSIINVANMSFTQTGHWFFTSSIVLENVYRDQNKSNLYGKSYSPFFKPRFNISDNTASLDKNYMISKGMFTNEFVVEKELTVFEYNIDAHKYYTQINIKFDYTNSTASSDSVIKYISIDNARTKVIETDKIKFLGDQLPYCVIPMNNPECCIGVNGGELMYAASKYGVIASEINNTDDAYPYYDVDNDKSYIMFRYNNKTYKLVEYDKSVVSMLNNRYLLSESYNTNNVYDISSGKKYTFANGYCPIVEFRTIPTMYFWGESNNGKQYYVSLNIPSNRINKLVSFAVTYNNSPENTNIPFQSVHPAGYYQIKLINVSGVSSINSSLINIGNSNYEIYYNDTGDVPKYVGNNIKLKGTKYVVQSSYPIMFDDEIIDSGIGTDYVRINNILYKLISVKGNTSSFAYNIDKYQNGKYVYFIQGQGYVDNGVIISDLNTGVTVKEINGFDYIGCDGRVAFYFSKATRQIYIFKGNQTLSLYIDAGNIKSFDNFKYFPFIDKIISQCTNVSNTTSTYIYNSNGMTELEFPKLYGELGMIDYSFDDGYNVLLFNGKDTYVKDNRTITKTSTTVEGILDFNNWNGHMKFSIPWYSLLSERRQVVDCIYIRTEHNKKHDNDNKQYLTINYSMQIDDKVISETKTFNSFAELVKFQPKNQDVCYAVKFDIETSCAIESITMSVIPQDDTTNMIKQIKI